MNLYGLDYSSLDLGLIDPSPAEYEYLSPTHEMIVDRRDREREVQNLLSLSNYLLKNTQQAGSPPKRRHDGTSPLPLGMDWSPPPCTWDGPNTTWPQDFHTGWSYCVTIPTWSFLSESEGSESGVFYRVQVGLQSPEGVTTSREVLRRFSDFLKMSSDLKRSYSKKKLQPPPPKGLFKMKSKTALEERRCALEDWMTKVLSDIDFSRSAPVACFLELEAVARLSFRESSQGVPDVNMSCNSIGSVDPASSHSDTFVPDGTSVLASLPGSTPEPSEFESELPVKVDNSEIGNRIPVYVDSAVSPREATVNEALHENDNANLSKMSREVRPMVEKQNQFLTATEQQLVTAKTEIVDLVARLNQEHAVGQYLTMQIIDLEAEFESAKKSAKENLEQAISLEKEQITRMQWDMEELRRKCMEMEFSLKTKQVESCHDNATKTSTNRENETLEEIESVREQLRNLQEAEFKSKSEVKLLVKEVKSLRSSQSELRQELEKVTEERKEFETRLQIERAEKERANAKLLHECEILHSCLIEFSVNFLIAQENKLNMDDSSSSDGLDRLAAAAENQIGHLLTQAQRLAQDVASPNNEDTDKDADRCSHQ